MEDVCDFAPRSPVPVVTIWPSLKDDVEEFRRLVGSGLPIFRSYRGCFASLAALSARRAAPGRAQDPPAASPDAELRRVLAANRGDGVPSAIAREIPRRGRAADGRGARGEFAGGRRARGSRARAAGGHEA